MQIVFLGTAAAEAIPNAFCRCRVCETARRLGGVEMRGRSALLVNDDLLIDLGPDLFASANRLRRYLGAVHTILITHRHEDHWVVQNLLWRRPSFTSTPLTEARVFGAADVVATIPQVLAEDAALSWQAVSAGDQWRSGEYQITAVPATHGGGELEALLYVVDDGRRRFLYGTDTGPLSEEAWAILKEVGRLDLVILDATSGVKSGGGGHHGMEDVLATRARMVDEGLIVPRETIMIAHHFSHNGLMTHQELVEAYGQHDIKVAFDGLTLEI